MTQPLVYRAAVKAEFESAYVWYENEKSGLGDDFVIEVRKTFDHIASQPERFPIAEDDIRVAKVADFPYCVYYRIRPGHIVVISVFHMSRNPSIWQRRK